MAQCRVFQNPDGTVRVMRLNERHRLPDETEEQFFAREVAKQPELAALPFMDLDVSVLPMDRSKRHAWRLVGSRVVVDPTIPDLPKPRDLIAELDALRARLGALEGQRA